MRLFKLTNILKSNLKLVSKITTTQSRQHNHSMACIVLTTTDKEEIADKIAHELVNDNLAACVQIDQVKSVYKWENKLQSDKEFRLMIKASAQNYDRIEKKISLLHNYHVPQILKLDITGGSSDYLNWLNDLTSK